VSIKIKNWSRFQHFKDRRPPWIKLYRDLLDDKDWHRLDPTAAKMLVSLWLLASENEGELPSVDDIAFRLRMDESKVRECLKHLDGWLISERYQGDINESQKKSAAEVSGYQETETETETDKDPSDLPDEPAAPRVPACPTQALIDLFHQHLPMLPRVEVMNDTRRKHLLARWKQVCSDPEIRASENPREKALEWFGWYFGHAATSKFLTGRAKTWMADFDFLINPTKFTKVIEGHYHKD